MSELKKNSKVMDFIKKHKKIGIFLLIALVIVIVVAINSRKPVATKPVYETATVEKRDITQVVTASGKVISGEDCNVTTGVSGIKINAINVEVGDYVNEGDVICTLDSSDLEKKLGDAKKQANVEQANSDLSLANSIMTYQKQVHSNQDANYSVDDNIDSLSIALENAQTTEDQACDAFWAVYNSRYEQKGDEAANDDDVKNLYNRWNTAKKDKQRAQEKYDRAVKDKSADLMDNQLTLQSNANTLQSAVNNASVTGIATNQQIDNLQKQVNDCTVKAPISGTITSLPISKGQTYTGTTICVIEDESKYQISSEINEYDIGSIQVGQDVEIKTNVTGETKLKGKVHSIAPRATTVASTTGLATNNSSTNITYNVKIDIDDDISALKLDMTAKLKIITQNEKDVVSVPYEAVQSDDDGYYVEVIDTEEVAEDSKKNKPAATPNTKKIYVTLGATSDFYAEISGAGLSEGMEVMLPVDNGVNGVDFMFGPMGGF